MHTSILPIGGAGRPLPRSRVHVSPPSRDMKMPLPGPPLSRPHWLTTTCHIPANSTRGLFGSITRLEAPVFSSTNRTFCQVAPPSFVRKMLAPAAARVRDRVRRCTRCPDSSDG